MKRYVIRIIGTNKFYNGKNTFSSEHFIFEGFEKAKVFKNIAGAKVACGNIYQHCIKNIEIVEIETKLTDNIISVYECS